MPAEAGQTIASFVGDVAAIHNRATPLPLTLRGAALGGRGEILLLAFAREPAQRIPDRLTDSCVTKLASGGYSIIAAEGQWLIEPCCHFLHRDVGQEFFRVLPPARVPWKKRAFWRLLLIMARLKV